MGRSRVSLGILAAVMVARCSTPASITPTATGVTTFDEGGIAFEFPAAWHEWHYQVVSSFTSVIAYLSSAGVAVPEPCATTVASDSTGVACEDRFTLQPDTLVVQVTQGSFPGFDITTLPADATAMTIGGLPGYVETAGPDAAVSGVDETVTWSLPLPGFVDNYYGIEAQMRGPDVAGLRTQLDALIASLRYDPPTVPLPTGSSAATAAAASALAFMVSGDSAWSCFPPSGSRQATITSLPMGPDLATPQVATCSTSIVPTAIQLWRMDLTVKLPQDDPVAGHGQTYTVWVNADGSPGGEEGGSPIP